MSDRTNLAMCEINQQKNTAKYVTVIVLKNFNFTKQFSVKLKFFKISL